MKSRLVRVTCCLSGPGQLGCCRGLIARSLHTARIAMARVSSAPPKDVVIGVVTMQGPTKQSANQNTTRDGTLLGLMGEGGHRWSRLGKPV
jgi:hypothetical protein